jgi:MOZ/SAS family
MIKCEITHPPGDEIYNHENHSVFEIDGIKNPTYCENIAYLSKLFLDHKNTYDDITPFVYYVLTENDESGHHMVGYFSREKESQKGWNLSCIMVFPFQQRKGYGKFLISFSYELSAIENKPGGPETPISDLGKASYVSWWIQRIIDYIREHKNESFSISDITKETFVNEKDIYETLVKEENLVTF